MAPRTMTRPPPRTSPQGPAAPAQQLRPRPSTHLRDGAALAALGAIGCGAANMTGHPQLDLPALAVGTTGGAVLVVAGERKKHRNALQDRLVESLAPLLGVRQPDRRIVRVKRWTRGWPGLPREMRLRYAPGIQDGETWKEDVLSSIAGRLLGRYKVTKQDRRNCVLWLRLVEDLGRVKEERPYSQIRAERAITELIGATVKVTGVELDDDQLRSIIVSHQAGAKLAASGYRTRVERVISTMMPGRWRAVWDLEGDSVRFEVRPTLPSSVWLPTEVPPSCDDLLTNYRQVTIPYAVDEDGDELVWYPARVPQVMLTGSTGTGKTSMSHALLGKVTQYGWPVWVLDAKRVEFLDFRTWPNVQIVAGSVPQQVALVRRVWELMEYRYQLIEEGKATVNDFEPLVVFLDEYAEFRNNLMEWYAQIKVRGEPTKPPTLAEVASLARKARTARIHLVLSTQRPDAEFLGGEMRDNFGQRISMGRLSPQGAMMMWENPAVGVSLPRACTGRATATHEDGRPVEVQCYRFPDPAAEEGSDEQQLLAAIRPAESRHPRLVIVPPGTDPDPETGVAPALTFRDYARAEWALASDRPDLDPLALAERGSGLDGRSLSSTMASLGLAGDGATSEARRLRVVEPLEGGGPAAPVHDVEQWSGDEYAGYAPAVPCQPRSLMVGDLIEVEEGTGIWVVVDETPEEDVVSPGMIAVSWRGDGDESGAVSLRDDGDIAVRRPEEDA